MRVKRGQSAVDGDDGGRANERKGRRVTERRRSHDGGDTMRPRVGRDRGGGKRERRGRIGETPPGAAPAGWRRWRQGGSGMSFSQI